MIWIIPILIALIINYFVAVEMRSIAESKGYETTNQYFWYCFLLGLPGWLIVAALPNKRIEKLLIAIKDVTKPQKINSQEANDPVVEKPTFYSSEAENISNIPSSTQSLPEKPIQETGIFASANVTEDGRIKCSKCGAVQNTGRRVCWECGATFITEG